MRKPRQYRANLADTFEASDKVASFIHGMGMSSYLAGAQNQYAVVRGFEVIGEATNKIPSAFKERHPQLPWREIAGMMDRLAHSCFGVNARVVWKTAVEGVPNIAAFLRAILSQGPTGTDPSDQLSVHKSRSDSGPLRQASPLRCHLLSVAASSNVVKLELPDDLLTLIGW